MAVINNNDSDHIITSPLHPQGLDSAAGDGDQDHQPHHIRGADQQLTQRGSKLGPGCHGEDCVSLEGTRAGEGS